MSDLRHMDHVECGESDIKELAEYGKLLGLPMSATISQGWIFPNRSIGVCWLERPATSIGLSGYTHDSDVNLNGRLMSMTDFKKRIRAHAMDVHKGRFLEDMDAVKADAKERAEIFATAKRLVGIAPPENRIRINDDAPWGDPVGMCFMEEKDGRTDFGLSTYDAG